MNTRRPLRVLMVCMGNICRSPTAEAVLRRKLDAAGLQGRVEVDSAGTYAGHAGSPPDPRAQEHAQRRGYDLSRLRARRIGARDLEWFDLVIAMDEDNRAQLSEDFPDHAPDKLRLLLEFSARHPAGAAVPDPYYGGPAGFELVLDLVEDACDGLIDHLRQHL